MIAVWATPENWPVIALATLMLAGPYHIGVGAMPVLAFRRRGIGTPRRG